MSSEGKNLIGVLYVGNDVVSFVVFDLKQPAEVASHKIPVKVISPKDGWFEYDPVEWLRALDLCVQNCSKHSNKIRAIGICNKHTTVVVWDKNTGKPFYNAIASQDPRIDDIISRMKEELDKKDQGIYKLSGWTCSSHCSMGELFWLRDHVPDINVALNEGRLMLGTIDTWLLWNLTGGINDGKYITDITNASRTMLMNIETLKWDDKLLSILGISPNILPTVRSNVENFGVIRGWSLLDGVPITGLIEERQSALIGHGSLTPGCALNTYGSNCTLTFNIGQLPAEAPKGLRTTVGYKLGSNEQTAYVIEANLQTGSEILRWVQRMTFFNAPSNNLKDLVDAVASIGTLSDCGGVYFVPAFNGLDAPHWRQDARGTMCGLTEYVTRDHITRAALQSICFQTREIFDLIRRGGILPLHDLYVAGEMTKNSQFLPLLADIVGFKIKRVSVENASLLGAAIVAGCATDVNLCDPETIEKKLSNDTFHPTASVTERMEQYGKWQMAVRRSFGWAHPSGVTPLLENKKMTAKTNAPDKVNRDIPDNQTCSSKRTRIRNQPLSRESTVCSAKNKQKCQQNKQK